MTRCKSCPLAPGIACPSTDWPGYCGHVAAGSAYWLDKLLAEAGQPAKARPVVEASAEPARPSIDPAVRDAVLACPDRGSVLPISMQAECGCSGKELTECRAGRGRVAGRVTLRDCIECRQVH